MNVATDKSRITLAPPALPATVEELKAQRRVFSQPNLNDFVDEYHTVLWEKPDYRALMNAVWDEDAVEGSLSADNIMAAQMIREHAKTQKESFVYEKKLATIVKALNTVCRRYQMSRNERRSIVHGVSVPNGDSGL